MRYPIFLNICEYGRLANTMFQVMFAREIERNSTRSFRLTGFGIPEWGIILPPSEGSPSIRIGSSHTRVRDVASLLNRYDVQRLDIIGGVMRWSNKLPPDDYADLFPKDRGSPTPVSPNRLLIHIRLGDVATPTHPLYGPLPVGYYRYLCESTGLDPTFIGELQPSRYVDDLHAHFSTAHFLTGGSPLDDFQTIRHARNIATAVSSFSLLAAFMSDSQCIHVPVAGMLDPRAAPMIDLLPIKDCRYTFHHIPSEIWASRYSNFRQGGQFCTYDAKELVQLKNNVERQQMLASLRVRLAMERHAVRDAISRRFFTRPI